MSTNSVSMQTQTWRRESLQESVSDPVLREDAEDTSSDSGDSVYSSENDAHSSDEECSNAENQDSKSGWADAIAKILRTNKPRKKRSIVLSRAKKLNEVSKKLKVEVEEPGFEVVKEEKPDLNNLTEETEVVEKPKRVVPKSYWASKGRVKPNILDKDREKVLSKIATKGVVQLFNVVRQHQKTIDGQLKEAGGLFRKEEQVLKSIDKRAFFDVLMGSNAKSEVVDNPPKDESPIKDEGDEGGTWHVLRDDFMMSAKMKDWNRTVDAGENSNRTGVDGV